MKQCLVVWRHYLLGAPFSVLSDHQSIKWLQTQNVVTLSDRLLRWVEFFSLFDFAQEYIPGELNVLPDHLSRPATEVHIVLEDTGKQPFDIVALMVTLHEHQHVQPILPVVCPIILETQVQSEFAKQLREAQEGNLEIVKAVGQFEKSTITSSFDL